MNSQSENMKKASAFKRWLGAQFLGFVYAKIL